MMNSPEKISKVFRFKDFSLSHGAGTWKVGMDSIMLGSWVELTKAKSVIDIGAGCGILSLLVASRGAIMQGLAVEIDTLASDECQRNFTNSPWSSKLLVLNADIKTLYRDLESYDLVICNPPFFHDSSTAPETNRQKARQGINFDWMDVPQISNKLLTAQGTFAVIVPVQIVTKFIALANNHGLYVFRRLNIRATARKPVVLVMIQCCRQLQKCEISTLIIRSGSEYTEEYKQLTNAQPWS